MELVQFKTSALLFSLSMVLRQQNIDLLVLVSPLVVVQLYVNYFLLCCVFFFNLLHHSKVPNSGAVELVGKKTGSKEHVIYFNLLLNDHILFSNILCFFSESPLFSLMCHFFTACLLPLKKFQRPPFHVHVSRPVLFSIFSPFVLTCAFCCFTSLTLVSLAALQ